MSQELLERVKILESLLENFDSFVTEDRYSCDYCEHCGYRYGNASLYPNLDRNKPNYNYNRLPHKPSCDVLKIQEYKKKYELLD